MTTENKQSKIKNQRELWDAFLKRWPIEKLKELTLEQYVSTEDQDTFTYWLETKTRPIGSIQGNTSAKFGIYKRNSEGKEQNGIAHGDVYTWRTRYGDNEQKVFDYVKSALINIVEAVMHRDLEAIDKIDFAPMVKWKIAFLYQDQNNPVLINTFFKPRLQILTSSDNSASFPDMYRKLVEMKGSEDLLEFGVKCWEIVHQKHKEIEQRSILNQFLHVKSFQKYLPDWSSETIEAFCTIVSEAYKNSLDVFTVEMTDRAMIRVGRKELSSEKAKSVFGLFTPTEKGIKFGFAGKSIDNSSVEDVCHELYQRLNQSKKFAEFKKLFPVKRKSYWPSDYLDNDNDSPEDNDEIGKDKLMLNQPPLNQILYGPPGTGKTYHTIEAAVNAANPQFIWDSREELKGEYDRLVSEKRIRFVTFHQSYGYEEFVEGLCPTTTEDNQIEYFVKPGVFKQICNDATASGSKKPLLANSNPRIWKLSIDGVKASKVRKYCFDNNIAAIGWGESGDMSSEQHSGEEENYFEQLGSLAKSSITEFSSRMAKGDIVVCVKGQWAIQAVGIVSGDYQFRKEGVEDRDDFCHVMPVEWLATGLDVGLYELNNNTRLTLKTCYELTRFTSTELFEHLEKNGIVLSKQENVNSKKENYVLVIDEINRGNISKIFGELITLIEPSKRKGASEALELVLPNSGKSFSVPDNLFLIGTMNTADRSLAMMDTALRRRFDFVEMMPKPEVFAETSKVKGIDLQSLLRALNQRIEILYDREHTLGHAFFMPVKELVDDGDEEQAFSALVSVFQNKIIPLLEEYFFEDWSKIRLVLADNQKKSQDLQFVSEQVQNTQQLNDLFGNNHELEQYGQSITKYTLADKEADVWTKPESYIGIYSTLVSSAE